jgi:hypothetical protein
MTTIVTRAGKGSALTHTEGDNNFTNLNTAKLENLSEDTTPQLGGNLDVNTHSIVSASNGDIAIAPNGTGKIVLDGLNWPTADGSADQVLKTNGSGQLSFTTVSGGGASALNDLTDVTITSPTTGQVLKYNSASSQFENGTISAIGSVGEDPNPSLGGNLFVSGNSIVSAANGNITITPDGTGSIVLDGLNWPQTDGSAGQVLSTNGSGQLSFTAAGGSGISWQSSVKTANFTAIAGEGYFCNTNGGAFTATLPSVPSTGDVVVFIDYKNSWNTNNLTVARNGNKIQDDFNDFTGNSQKGSVTLIYADATVGWLVQKTVN